MRTPRLAFLLLLSLCAVHAPTRAHAVETWTPVAETGDEWRGVTFTDENGEKRGYFFKPTQKGGLQPLYVLTPRTNSAVTKGVYYESVQSAYSVDVVVTPASGNGRSRSPESRTYVVTREGTSLRLAAEVGWTLGASTWEKANPPAYEDKEFTEGRPAKKVTRKVRTNPYVPGSVTVVVASPAQETEKLADTPMRNYVAPSGKNLWDDYYFVRPAGQPRSAGRGGVSDPDRSYREAMEKFKPMHSRVLPLELMLKANACFVVPENCVSTEKNPQPSWQPYMDAGAQAVKGNLLPTEALAVDGHKFYKGLAQEILAEIASGSETEFGPKELDILQKILIETDQRAAFQKDLTESRGKPEDLKLFVKKWRDFVKNELELYVKDADAAGGKEVAFNAKRAEMRARAAEVAAKPLKPAKAPAKPVIPGVFDPSVSKIDAVSPANEWFAFTATPAPGGMSKFYCHMGPMRGNIPMALNALAGKSIECVSLKQPEPKAVNGVLTGEVNRVAAGSVVLPPPADLRQTKLNGLVVPYPVFSLGEGKPLSGVVSFKPVTKLPPPGTKPDATDPAPVPETAAPAVALSDKEQSWLTGEQKGQYQEALAAVAAAPEAERAAKTAAAAAARRKLIVENLAPKAEASAYQTAAANPKATAAELDKALPAEVWGAGVKEAVGLSGPNADLQLSPEEYAKLSDKAKKLDAALKAYTDGRKNVSDPGPRFDGVKLHLTAMAARKALNPGAAAPATGEDAPVPELSDAEVKLLTPAEKKQYDHWLGLAKGPPKTPSANATLQTLITSLQKRIKDEKRTLPATPVAPPTSAEEFAKLQDWQKRKFCAERPASAASIAADANAPELRGNGANLGLNASADAGNAAVTGNGATRQPTGTAPGAAWADEACKPYKDNEVVIPSGNGQGSLTATIPPVPTEKKDGDDKEVPKKKPNEWITAPLVRSAVAGGMVGLLVGSLFGPVGLIAGPLIGAGLYYGLTKVLTKKDDA